MTSTRPFVQDDVFTTGHIMAGRLAPGGGFSLYQLRSTARGPTGERSHDGLWRVDLATGAVDKITPPDIDATSPYLASDTILYALEAEAGAAPQLCRRDLSSGMRTVLTDFPGGVTTFALSPDKAWVALAAAQADTSPADHSRTARPFYRCDAVAGHLEQVGQALYLLATAGGEPRALTPHDGLVADIIWSPTRPEFAALVGGRESHAGLLTLGTLIRELIVLDMDGASRSLATNDWIEEMCWTADGERLAFVALPYGDFAREFQLWTVDRNGGPREDRSSALPVVPGNNVQLNNPTMYGKSGAYLHAATGEVIVSGSTGPKNVPWALALDGPPTARPLVDGDRTCRVLDLRGEQLLISAQTFTQATTLRLIDLATGQDRELADPNAASHREIAQPRIDHVVATNSDGMPIEGWIFRPPSAVPRGTILYIHGGPFMTFGHAYQEDFLELVGDGYAVAFCNPRGSTGYGDAFSTPIVGRWGELELDDLNSFLDALVQRRLADDDHLAVTGYSGGGHLSAWLIGHGHRFRAAIPEQGLYNLISAYGVSDASGYFEYLMGGLPHERPDDYWRYSPLAFAHRVRTPTLLIQGEDDLRCPMEQAEQYYTALHRAGCTVELLRLRDCHHTAEIGAVPSLRRLRMNAIKDWLNCYV